MHSSRMRTARLRIVPGGGVVTWFRGGGREEGVVTWSRGGGGVRCCDLVLEGGREVL